MRSGTRAHTRLLALCICALAAWMAGTGSADAQSSWRLEQPAPPPAPPGVPEATAPVGLGRVGDIEFSAPNRGVLITAGNPPTVPAGVWIYNGAGWRELATVCGATDGRIAWAAPQAESDEGAPSEFWTVSDGRPGQAEVDSRKPPLIDNTLCRFAEGKVIESFAAPAFEANSYQPMHAAACLSAEDCWFAGNELPEESPEIGAFQLHWNGATMSAAPYPNEGHAIWDMRQFEGRLYESVELLEGDPVVRRAANPPPVHVLDPELPGGFGPERLLTHGVLYGEGELPWALGYLHLSAGAGALWAAAGQRPDASEAAPVTVLRYTPEAGGEWTQVLGPNTEPSGAQTFPGQTVEAVATEPGSGGEDAWLALETIEEALETERETPHSSSYATVAQISADGAVTQETLPSAAEPGVGPRGAADKLTCPAPGDCWMVTSEGWLYHLAPEGERTLPEDSESGFGGVITERPPDQGLPQTLPDSIPPDNSGLAGEIVEPPQVPSLSKTQEEVRVAVPLVSGIHTRLRHGTTLELRFHLAVKARIQLLAKRKHRVVAKTAVHVLKAGEHKLLLRLNRKRWPTELHLVEHPLAPLPSVSTRQAGSETVTTSLAFPAFPHADRLGLP